MLFDELLKLRRSCRKYLKKPVVLEDVEKMIESTLLAPSWENYEASRYYLALSEEATKFVYDCLPDFNQEASLNAAYLICTFKKNLSGTANGSYVKEGDLWGAYDLGLQNSYLCLKASDMGYDTLIMGLRDDHKLREYFNIPEDEIMLPVIALGYRDGDCKFYPRKEVSEVLKVK